MRACASAPALDRAAAGQLPASHSSPRLDQLEIERDHMLARMDRRIAAARAAESAARAADATACDHVPARYDADASEVEAFLIDLDGTIYSPRSLLPGAQAFYDMLRATGKPFVFLSNTGAKGSAGVQTKFRGADHKLEGPMLSLRNVYTAAEAQMEYLRNTVPSRAKVFVVSGGSFWTNMLRMKDPLLYDSWDLRTALSTAEAKEWAVQARRKPGSVFVVFFIDGAIAETADPSTGETGVSDWSYETIQKATYMCQAGAEFVYTADDAFNATVDPAYTDTTFPAPGPGMFAAMMRTAMFPQHSSRVACCGKGGNVGQAYMMEHAIKMLELQATSPLDRAKIMIIGDRFDTDIKAGKSVGIKTCLVESGCHSASEQRHFPDALADFFAPNIGALVPSAATAPPSVPSPCSSAVTSPCASEQGDAPLPGEAPLQSDTPKRSEPEPPMEPEPEVEVGYEEEGEEREPRLEKLPYKRPALNTRRSRTKLHRGADDEQDCSTVSSRRFGAAGSVGCTRTRSGNIGDPGSGSLGMDPRVASDVFEAPSRCPSIDRDAAAFDRSLAAAMSGSWSKAPPGCAFTQEPCLGAAATPPPGRPAATSAGPPATSAGPPRAAVTAAAAAQSGMRTSAGKPDFATLLPVTHVSPLEVQTHLFDIVRPR